MINGFTIFGLKIYFYAIIIIIGAIAGAFLAGYEAKRKGLPKDMIWDILPWLLIAGIIGARLWHVFTPADSMLIDGRILILFIRWTSLRSGQEVWESRVG